MSGGRNSIPPMSGPLRGLALLLPLVASILMPAAILAEEDAPPPVAARDIDRDIDRNAAMAHGLAAAPGAGAEGQSVLLTMAVQGHAQSQYLLGIMPREGTGTAHGHALAVKWLERAAAQGHEGALAHLARMATHGDAAASLALGLIALGHMDRDRPGSGAVVGEAARHLRAAAAAGDPQGLLALAALHRAGRAVERDEAYAAVLFRAAAAAAMTAVQRAQREAVAGSILGAGSGAWLEEAFARTRAAHAAPPAPDSRHPDLFARYWVGLMLLAGADTAADIPRGLAHHRAAAEAEGGFVLAEFSLGLLHERGHGLPRDLAEARRWFTRAAAHGHPLATTRLEDVTAEMPAAAAEGSEGRPSAGGG